MVKIFVKAFTNKIITLKVSKSDSVASIKNQIELLEQILISQQRLIFMGIELNDQQSIAQYKIQEGSTIICESSVLLITLPSGGITTFAIDSDDTVDHVKHRISKERGIPKMALRLFYSCCSFRGKQLDDSKTISDNKIGGNLVHVLQAVQGTQIFVEILESTRTIMNIPVRMSDTLIQIKKKIQKKVSHNIMHYKLFINDNEMDNDKTLADYYIKNETVLQLCEGEVIFVKRLSDEKFKVRVNRSDTIEQLKMKIEQKIDVPLKLQTLNFHNTELNDSKTLAEYDIGFGMKVELKTGIRIFISSALISKMVFELPAWNTVRALKEAIKVKIGVPEDHQKIFRGSDELLDNQWRGFQENEQLMLLICSGNHLILNVFFDGTSNIVSAVPSDNILSVKKKVEEKHGKPVTKYFCYFKNKLLDNNLKLENIGVSNMSELELSKYRTNFFQVYVKSLTGEKISLIISNSDTIEYVKRKIQIVKGIPVDQHRLCYKGMLLQDHLTVKEYCIEENSILFLILRLTGC